MFKKFLLKGIHIKRLYALCAWCALFIILTLATIFGESGDMGEMGRAFAMLNLSWFGYLGYVYLLFLIYPAYALYKDSTLSPKRIKAIIATLCLSLGVLLVQYIWLGKGLLGELLIAKITPSFGGFGVWILIIACFYAGVALLLPREIAALQRSILKLLTGLATYLARNVKEAYCYLRPLITQAVKSSWHVCKGWVAKVFASPELKRFDRDISNHNAPNHGGQAYGDNEAAGNGGLSGLSIPASAKAAVKQDSAPAGYISPANQQGRLFSPESLESSAQNATAQNLARQNPLPQNPLSHNPFAQNPLGRETKLDGAGGEFDERAIHVLYHDEEKEQRAKEQSEARHREMVRLVSAEELQEVRKSGQAEVLSIDVESAIKRTKAYEQEAPLHDSPTYHTKIITQSPVMESGAGQDFAPHALSESTLTQDSRLHVALDLGQDSRQDFAPHVAPDFMQNPLESTSSLSAHAIDSRLDSMQNPLESTNAMSLDSGDSRLDTHESLESSAPPHIDSVLDSALESAPDSTKTPQSPHNFSAQDSAPQQSSRPSPTIVSKLESSRALLATLDRGERKAPENYTLPPTSLLQPPSDERVVFEEGEIDQKIQNLLTKLKVFKIDGDVARIYSGPVVSTFEFRPAPNVKVSRIQSLSDDLAMALSARSIRIQAPIPGKDVVGIEVPNSQREMIFLREILESDVFRSASSPLVLGLGKDIVGNPFVTDLQKLPHLLIAGTTGSGKSVGLNAMILSLLYRNSPDNLKLIMIDPKKVEFSLYEEIPHLLTPIITDAKKAIIALSNVAKEMERRYEVMKALKTKTIDSYNAKAASEGAEILPFIVVIIDELADLMMTGGKEAEGSIIRIAQMGRAAGLHLIVATQRPSVDVVTGLIKTNLPAKIAYKVNSRMDSRVILDTEGAQNLLGQGDMLFSLGGSGSLLRLHAPWASEEEIESIVEFIKSQREVEYDSSFLADSSVLGGSSARDDETGGEGDDLLEEAKKIMLLDGKTSISNVQRRLGVGYNKAASLVEALEKQGFLSAPNAKGVREIL